MAIADESGPEGGEGPELLPWLFQRVARQHPDRTAVEWTPSERRPKRRTLSYRELAQRVAVIAKGLKDEGSLHASLEDELVAIFFDRESEHLYAAQLGVMTAGAAYVCMNASYPDARLRYMLEDAAPRRILAGKDDLARLRGLVDDPDLVVDVEAWLAAASDAEPEVLPEIAASSLAYVIYTSGTTGRPKGVMIEHGSIANLVHSDIERFGIKVGDRVVQGSSPIYDSSVEELWLGLAVGATVVVMDDDTARSGPDIVTWLKHEEIAVFCPPPTLLRATGCRDPQTELPQLRLLYVGGEALPPDVAALWSRGCRLENGYGPTECTVTVIRTPIAADHVGEIPIGRPVEGHEAFILDPADGDETKRNCASGPRPEGEVGELCIKGPGLAREYLGNAELTEERFPRHETLGRIYRTGDLAVQRQGVFYYLGRIDSQIKIRGHRVELEEVDACLAEHPAVREAAAFVQGDGAAASLSAWVVVAAGADSADERAEDSLRRELLDSLRQRLPLHMVPGRIGFCEKLPTTIGGKLDRKALMPVPSAAEEDEDAQEEAVGRFEILVSEAFGASLDRSGINPVADFFEDLGGDSLAAAMVVSHLRGSFETERARVRDLYEQRTVRAIAAVLETRASQEALSPKPTPEIPTGDQDSDTSLVTTTLLQSAWLASLLIGGSGITALSLFGILPWILGQLSLPVLIFAAPLLAVFSGLLWAPVAVGLTVLAKRILIGEYRPLRARAWGRFHRRNWIVQRFSRTIPWGLVAGTVYQGTILRALGARIGERVHIHRGVDLASGGWDLLTVGDDVTVGQDAALRLVDIDDGSFVVGPIDLGDGATLDVRAGASGGTRIGRHAELGPLSSLESGMVIPDSETWCGVPAEKVEGESPAEDRAEGRAWDATRHGQLQILTRLLLAWCFSLPVQLLTLAACLHYEIDAARAAAWLDEPTRILEIVGVSILIVCGWLPCHLILQALACRMIGPDRPQVIPRYSLAYLRVWLATGLVESAGEWLSGSLFWPWWLRLAGMQIGRGSEISTITDVLPKLVRLGEECFFADGIYLGGPKLSRSVVTTGTCRFGRSTFLGNHVVVPAGQDLPDEILLGVCTVADDRVVKSGTSWFGYPAFRLPKREVASMPRSLTHDPGLVRYLHRLFWESLRFLLPSAPLAAAGLWVALAARPGTLTTSAAAATVASLAGAFSLCGAVLVLKWLLLGRVRPGQHAFWSAWCCRWDFVYVAWGRWARPLLASLEQTIWLAGYLRLIGCRIGRRVLLGLGFAQVVDPDMIRIEDDAAVNGLFQAHSFEDRVLKIDEVRIGKAASTAAGSVLLYGADVGDGARVAPHSVVMKRERLLPGRIYRGCPTRDDGTREDQRR